MNSRILARAALILATAALMGGNPFHATAADTDTPQYYEIRVYSTQSDTQRQRVNDYWQNAAIPAYNRMGIRPVGVFTEQKDSETNKIYVLIPCDSLEIFGAIPARLAADADYQKAAAGFLGATKADPAYVRLESSLLVAFDGMKHLVAPDKTANVFELRTYLSPGEGMGLNKIRMFESGEITLMKDIGLAPVFYGRMLTGSHMPCLMYLTCGENLEEHRKHWQAFGNAPVWKQLLADPQYKDNMIGMISVMLKRTPASQI
jgi:hypothetical protein